MTASIDQMTIDRKRVAYHQAAHALCAALSGFLFDSVSIKQDSTGNCSLIIDNAFEPQDVDDAWRWAIVCYAGIAAEFLLTGERAISPSDGSRYDFEQVCMKLKDAGYEEEGWWDNLEEKLLPRAINFLSDPMTWAEVGALANALLENETLTYEEAMNEMLDARRLFEEGATQ